MTDVVLTAQERVRLSGKLEADNYGSRFSGLLRYGGELSYGGITGYGDKFTFRGLGSDETLKYFRALYETPVGGYGTHLRSYYSYSENMVGEEFTALNAWSWFQVVGAEVNQAILRTSGFNLYAFGGAEYKRVENDIQGGAAGKDDIRTFRLGFSGDYRDRLLGRTYFGMTWFQGVPWLGGNFRNDPGATRPDNPGAFSKWTFDLARLQSLIYGGSYLILRGFAQLSSQNLVSAEQYSIGGYYTVRGYPLSERSGDQGYAVSTELVVPVPYLRDWLQAAAFVDHGGVFPISPDKGAGVREHYLSGVGGGLRLNLPAPYLLGGTFQVRLDYGYAVGPRPSSTTNRLMPATDRGILYLSTAIRF